MKTARRRHTLADFVAVTLWEDVAAQSHEAKRSILNFFATALGSAYDPAVTSALRALLPFSGGQHPHHRPSGTARCDRRGLRQCDFGQSARFRRHPSGHDHSSGGTCRGAGSGAGASAGLSGRAVLTAFILGVEVECRIGNAVSPGHYARGWHITSTCGVFGAAAACAKLLGLSADGIANAIGIAASQSAGHRRKSSERGQECQRRQRRAQRPVCGVAGRRGLCRFAARDRGTARLGARHGRRARHRTSDWRSWQDLGDREEYLQALSGGHRVSCRDRRLFQTCARNSSAHRRHRVRHGARLGAAAGARRPSGAQRPRRAGQHSPLRRLCASARRGGGHRNLPRRSYSSPTSWRCARR